MKPVIAIPATLLLVARAYSKKSLTPSGIVAAAITAAAHAYHPWNLPFVLLCVFFLAGTRVTHIKEKVKAGLTLSSTGATGSEGPRTHVQVLANSLVASILSVLHARQLSQRAQQYLDADAPNPSGSMCYSWGGDVLIVGIIANYAAVAADTFSSELGILSRGEPRLITSLTLRKVPRGTNGGVSLMGFAAGLFGSMVIVSASMVFLPYCTEDTAKLLGGGAPWKMLDRRTFMLFLVASGLAGSVLDSVLGGLFQRSVRDVRSGKIVEGPGGNRVLVSSSSPLKPKTESAVDDDDEDDAAAAKKAKAASGKDRKPSFGDERPSRVVESGWDLLDNNDVNFLMAVTVSIGAMAVAAWHWGISPGDILKP